jgi:lysophospholipase L1-like esterase
VGWRVSSSGSGSGTDPLAVHLWTPVGPKTANYSAAAGELVRCDPTGGGFTVTLPNAPANGTRVAAKITTATAPNAVTIACAGSDVFNRASGPTSTSLVIAGQAAACEYDATGHIWTIVGSDTPVGSLDTRLAPIASGVDAWAASTAYTAGKVVKSNGQLWQVEVAHTSGASFDRSKFSVLVPARSPHGQVAASRSMVSGAVSGVSGRNYNTRLQHTTYGADIGSLRLVYTNFGSDLEPSNPVVVSASIEYPASTYWPVTFGGKKRVTIDPGQLAVSDVVGVDIPASTTFYTRSYWAARDVANDKVVLTTNLGAAADGFTFSSTPEADHTLDGTAMTPGTGVAPAPAMVLAQRAAISGVPVSLPCPMAVGDSILWGQGDSNDWRNGYWVRACDAAGIPTINTGRSAELGSGFATFSTSRRRRQLLQFATSLFIQYGTNDVNNSRTLVQLQTDVQTIVAYATRRGLPVFLGTITPLTTSTDSWATTGNQTPYGGTASRETIRKQYNAWVRAGVAGVAGYFEIADQVESARDSGLWKAPSYTADGTHPTATGHAAVAAAIDVTRMA